MSAIPQSQTSKITDTLQNPDDIATQPDQNSRALNEDSQALNEDSRVLNEVGWPLGSQLENLKFGFNLIL